MGLSVQMFEPLFSSSFDELSDGAFFVLKGHLEDPWRKDVTLYVKCEEAGDDCAMNLTGFWPQFQPMMGRFSPTDEIVQVLIDLALEYGGLLRGREPDVA